MNTEVLVILILGIGSMAIIAACIGYLYYVRIWFRAYTVGTPVQFSRLFGLTARRLSAYKLISAYARATEAGIDISLDALEAEYSAGNDPSQIVHTLMEAHRQGRSMSIQEASDRAGESKSSPMPA